MGVDGEEVGAGRVAAGDDEVGANVALVAEQVLLEHGHAGDDARLAARRQRVQLQLRRDERRRELGVGGGAGAGAPNLRRDVVQFLAVLVGDDGARGGSRIGGNLTNERVRGKWEKLGDGSSASRPSHRGGRAIKTYHDTAIIYAADNGRTGAGGLGQGHTARVQGRIAVVVGEVEPRHRLGKQREATLKLLDPWRLL